MEFLKINENKLKITLGAEELEKWGISAEDLDGADLRSRAFLRKILRQAEREVGFFTEQLRTLVQLYVSRDGGCELFVSRITQEESCNGEGSISLEHPSCTLSEANTSLFGFDSLEWLLIVCRRLRAQGFCQPSRAYRDTEGRYYLLLEGVDLFDLSNLNEYTFIFEFGSCESPDSMVQKLREHGRLICGNRAVDQLGIL